MPLAMAHKIIQWNCRSARTKKSDLIYLINKYQPVIFAIQETWLKPCSRFRLQGFLCVRDDRSDGYAGVAILISNIIPFSVLTLPPHTDSFNIIAVRAFNISFISIYIPRPNSQVISEISSLLSAIPHPILLLGDFNVHHISWGSHFSDQVSPFLLDFIDIHNLCILNDGSPTRKTSPSQNIISAVDLSLCSPPVSSRVSWQVLPSSFGSDHYPILVSFPGSHPPPLPFNPRLKHKLPQAEWTKFSSVLENEISRLAQPSADNVHEVYTQFKNALLKAADSSIPLKKPPPNKIPFPPWWDHECSLLVKRRKDCEREFTSSMTLENYLIYQKVAAETTRTLAERKKLGWFKFCDNLSPTTPPSIVWKAIKRFRGSFSEQTLTVCDPAEWIHEFSQKLSPPSAPSLSESSTYSDSSVADKFDSPFSLEELHYVLIGLKDSSPGIDGIPYSFITKSSLSAKHSFLNILNHIFMSGLPPEEWKSQIVLPILKPGKLPNDPSGYRPIALSSTLAKILEHLIKNRLEWIVESRGLLAKSQFGFRKGMSTLDSLSIFVTDIRLAFSKKESVIGIFLDISAAYDNVLLPLLRQKLLNLSIPVKMVNFISNFLLGRSLLVNSQGSLLPPRLVWKGLPQGSVLSPLLYSIYTYDLELSVNSFCNVLQYADDLALYISSDNFAASSARLNSAISYLYSWLSDHGLSLSIPKSSVVIFSRKTLIPVINISYAGQTFPVKENVKFLGVILDSKLSGTPHINHIIKKCEKNINILRSLSGVWWGSHPYTQKLLYNALIRSHLDYGSFLLEPCNKEALRSLDKIQSKCMRIIIGAMKSSPINALQVECVEPPLSLRRQYLCDRFVTKIFQSSSHILLDKLRELSQLISAGGYWANKSPPCLVKSLAKITDLPNPVFQCRINPLFLSSFEAIIFRPDIVLDIGIHKETSGANAIFNSTIDVNWPDWTCIFTDASKLSDESSVGAAVWIPKYSIVLNFKLPPCSSVYTGEAVAILEALKFIESHSNKLLKCLIFSDSKSCLEAILSNQFRSKFKSPIILNIKLFLHKLHLLGILIKLIWIPGHTGILGNETADSLAKTAVESGSPDEYSLYPQDLVALAKTHLFRDWHAQWSDPASRTGRYYAAIQKVIPPKPWFFKHRLLNKKCTSIICRLRLGHACTPPFLKKIRVRDNSLCECGIDIEENTLQHIFYDCPRNRSSFNDFLPSEFPRSSSVVSLLSNLSAPVVNSLSLFINSNNIKL